MRKYTLSVCVKQIVCVLSVVYLFSGSSAGEAIGTSDEKNNKSKNIEIFISGDEIKAAEALMHLMATPNEATENTELILQALLKCKKEFNIDYIPLGVGGYQENWTRAECALVILADSIRSSDLIRQRRLAQDSLMDFCEKATENDYINIRGTAVYEAAVQCIFYPCNLNIEPEYGIDKHLEILQKLVDRYCVKNEYNPKEVTSFYKICAHTEIEEVVEKYIFTIEASSGDKRKQYLDILKIPSKIEIVNNWVFFESIKESTLFELKSKTADELIELYVKDNYNAQVYREAIVYVLCETKKKQSVNITKLIKEYDKMGLGIRKYILCPTVYEFSESCMKDIIDRYLEFAEKEIRLEKNLQVKERPYHDKIAIMAGDISGYLANAYRYDKYAKLYQREKIIRILLVLIKYSDDSVSNAAIDALEWVVRKDDEYRKYVMDEIKKIDKYKDVIM